MLAERSLNADAVEYIVAATEKSVMTVTDSAAPAATSAPK
jgi:hypothetical protein